MFSWICTGASRGGGTGVGTTTKGRADGEVVGVVAKNDGKNDDHNDAVDEDIGRIVVGNSRRMKYEVGSDLIIIRRKTIVRIPFCLLKIICHCQTTYRW